ncbi:MarR family transcriptional regulator [Xylophilus sp. GW821-FHT01B05]
MKPLPTASTLLSPQCLEDLLLYQLARTVRVCGSMATRLVEGGFGITRREWGMVASLYGAGEITSSALAERLHLDRVRTSRALQGLVKKGLVERRHGPQDRREVRVQLSDNGRQLYAELFPRIARLNTELLADIAPAQVEVLLQCLQQLEARGQALQQMGHVTDKADRRTGGAQRRRWAEPAV